MPRTKDTTNYIGQIFNRLTVLALPSYGKGERQLWECLCDCGKIVVLVAKNVRSGHTKSCGCFKKDMSTKHGLSDSPEYHVWEAMIGRCTNPLNPEFGLYGGRGITVCKEWADFRNFIADMGFRPSPKHSLDRYPDQNGGYNPRNCRWATRNEQNRNKRNNRNLTLNGVTMCLTEWAIHTGMSPSTLDYRIRVKNMSLYDALSLPKWKRLPIAR